MAISMGGGGEDRPMGDMNTTPLIDVMLVMLIMFIITLPIPTHAVKIDLPSDNNSSQDLVKPDKNKLVVDASGQLLWNGVPTDQAGLGQLLQQSMQMPVEPELQFQPDPIARYHIVDDTLATIKKSGVTKLGFVGNEQYAREF